MTDETEKPAAEVAAQPAAETAPTQETKLPPVNGDGFTNYEGPMVVYNFDRFGAYTGSETIYRPEGFGPPGNATFIAPPEVPSGHVAVFHPTRNGLGSWEVVEDHRGTVVYSKADGSGIQVVEPGPVSSSYTTQQPTSAWAKWDEATNAWVIDTDARTAALRQQANSIMQTLIMPMTNYLTQMGRQPGPKFSAYREAIQDIAWGNTEVDALPPTVQNPTL